MNSRKSPIYLSITLLMFCLFAHGCATTGGNTNGTTSNTGNQTAGANANNTPNNVSNQSGTGNSTPPTASGAPTNVSLPPSTRPPSPIWGPEEWGRTASTQGGANGQQFIFTCSPNPSGRLSPVTGTDLYTIGSSICAAAVHAGVITREGGAVRFEIKPGASSYTGSARNGVTSNSSGALTGTMNWSFVFVR